MTLETINKRIIEHYGVDIQSNIWMEECAELIQVISKVKRYGIESKRNNLVEEMTDVLICIQQICIAYNISDDELMQWQIVKQGRNEERLEHEIKSINR